MTEVQALGAMEHMSLTLYFFDSTVSHKICLQSRS